MKPSTNRAARRSDTPQGRTLLLLGCMSDVWDLLGTQPTEEELMQFMLDYGRSWGVTREDILTVLNSTVRDLVLPSKADAQSA